MPISCSYSAFYQITYIFFSRSFIVYILTYASIFAILYFAISYIFFHYVTYIEIILHCPDILCQSKNNFKKYDEVHHKPRHPIKLKIYPLYMSKYFNEALLPLVYSAFALFPSPSQQPSLAYNPDNLHTFLRYPL